MVKAILTISGTALAAAFDAWHGAGMRSSKNPVSGGVVMAITTTVGAIWGAREGQPSAGLLIGLGVGAAISLLIWLFDRR
jgi:hypothetical protein